MHKLTGKMVSIQIFKTTPPSILLHIFTVRFPYIETCGMRKGGKMKEEGGVEYEHLFNGMRCQ